MRQSLPRARRGSPSLVGVAVFCLLIATVCLLFCSKSSPLYPINDWSDANIYFSMGKAMAQGQVIYRDVYDHKGPLLYGLHALCALVSPLGFTGVWLLEIGCLAAFLGSVYQYLRLYGVGKAALLVLPLAGALVTASYAFQSGDSAEELCLPLLSFSLLWMLRYLKTEAPTPLRAKTALLAGVLCGCVLWIKFTMLGLHLAWIVVAFLSQAKRGQWKAAWASLIWYGVGIGLATAPWLVYFGGNGAILDWFKVYFYDNLVLYSSGGVAAGLSSRAWTMAAAAFRWSVENPLFVALLVAGLLWSNGWSPHFKRLPRPSAFAPWERLFVWLCLGLLALGVFVGGKTFPYYGLILTALMGVALTPLALWMDSLLKPPAAKRWTPVLCGVAAVLAAALLGSSGNVRTSFLQPKESTMQYQLAAVMKEQPGATLLNYGFMDAGFFTASGIVPSVKYFHQTNVPLPEMLEEQTRYIDEGLCTFVVTRGLEPDSMLDKYELAATADSPGFWYEHVYLYRLRDPGKGDL